MCLCLLSFRLSPNPSPLCWHQLALCLCTKRPKQLNLLPGLGAVPAPQGAAGWRPPAHPGFPKAQQPVGCSRN